jgi:hypothetical protein
MIITVDFETYYDKEFSLSKITTEEYVRDERFETIGVGVKVDDGETQWFSGTHKETQAFLSQYDWGALRLMGQYSHGFSGLLRKVGWTLFVWRVQSMGWMSAVALSFLQKSMRLVRKVRRL